MRAEGDGWAIEASPDWSQGRTLYGGMTAAIAHETARRVSDLPLKSAQFLFVGPASGTVMAQARLLRQGKSSAAVAVEMTGEQGAAAQALFAFGKARESAVAHAAPSMPDVPSPEECGPLFPAPPPPAFFANFEMRLAAGQRPFAGGEPYFAVWVRFVTAPGGEPVSALLALADALPPSAMVAFPTPAPISTLTWSIDLAEPVSAIDGWYLLEARAEQGADGYSNQDMGLWSADGRCLLRGRQTIAIFV